MVTGHGAGFVMCWQNDVQLNLAVDQDPKNFMVVNSANYVLAIPDLGHYARQENDALDSSGQSDAGSSISSHKQLATFKKTIMKLNGNVQWKAGLVFERNLDEGGRSFEFIPHYEVVLKHPKYAAPTGGKVSAVLKVPEILLTSVGVRCVQRIPQSPYSYVRRGCSAA
jgi:hypothetical protein